MTNDAIIILIGLVTLCFSGIAAVQLRVLVNMKIAELKRDETTTECGPLLTPEPELIAGQWMGHHDPVAPVAQISTSTITETSPSPDVRVLCNGRYAGWVKRGSSKYILIQQGALHGMKLDE